MVDKKTGRLFATATQLGAILGNGTRRQCETLKAFGQRVGRAFQIQDDLLDVIADEERFGKRIGGDILEGKKTFLLVEALRRTRGPENRRLRKLMARCNRSVTASDRRSLVDAVTGIYEHSGALEAARSRIRRETAAGVRALRSLPRSHARSSLEWIAGMLVQRSH